MTAASPVGAAYVLHGAPAPRTVSKAAQVELTKPFRPDRPTLAEQRQVCADVQETLGAKQLDRYGVTMEDSVMGGVPVRIFTPSTIAPDTRDCILLNLHGGGFTKDAGSITENVPIAALAQARVIAARYRMAPEHRFPAAVDDAESVYRALLDQYSPSRIGLYGTSAGAILCTQLLVRLQQQALPLPAALGFFSGTADLSRTGDSEFFFRPIEDIAALDQLWADYVGEHDASSPDISPIFANLKVFPATLCVAGTRDFLLSQTALLHRALRREGVAADLVVFEAMPHAHWIYLELPESDDAFAVMSAFLRRAIKSGGQ
ncbi:alpha/beta hydrolase [Terricaulis silvestris]|uniref:Monoterpene epsilon-lactone hydrolase n=1 Tax=Terricaulis silvestris TaxID=2686094 RepID=A0A6I6MKB1_9CAUL|nr:alpha/beta hydrolase [Terricaulis silvestris]QGZ93648.1 Monoterpene epsilon-lactone hydrolase [Terricaulis silvestris]